jgi:hypothetical protein
MAKGFEEAPSAKSVPRRAALGVAASLAALVGVASGQDVLPGVLVADGIAADAQGRVFAVVGHPASGLPILVRYGRAGAVEGQVALGQALSYRLAFDRVTGRLFVLAPSGTIFPVDPETLQVGPAIADLGAALMRASGNVYDVLSGQLRQLQFGAPGFHDFAVYTRADGILEFFVSGLSQFNVAGAAPPGQPPSGGPDPFLGPLPRQIVVRLRLAPDGSGQSTVVLFADTDVLSSRGTGLALGAGRVFVEIPLPNSIAGLLMSFGLGFPEDPAQAPTAFATGQSLTTKSRGMDSDAPGNVYVLQEVGADVTSCPATQFGATVLAIPAANPAAAVCVESPGALPGGNPLDPRGGSPADASRLVTWDVGATPGGEFLWVPTDVGLFAVGGPFVAPVAPVGRGR